MGARVTRPKWIRDQVRRSMPVKRFAAYVATAANLKRQAAEQSRIDEAEYMVRWQRANCTHAGCMNDDLDAIEAAIREVAEGLPEGVDMPIKGLTDGASVKPAFTRLGKLRKGAPKDDSRNKPGADLDYMRFTGEGPDAAAIEKVFAQAFGDEPKEIECFLPYAGVDDNFATWKEVWSAGGLQHRCDGETCVVWLGSDGKYHHEPKPCPGGCDEIGRLTIVVRALLQAGYTGFVTVETHSINDILTISSALEAASQLTRNHDLRGIPWLLRRVPEMVSTPGRDGKRVRREKWMLKLVPDPRWAERKFLQDRDGAETPALPAGNGVGAEADAGYIDAEAELIGPGDEPTTPTRSTPPQPAATEAKAATPPATPIGEGEWARIRKGFIRDQLPIGLHDMFVSVAKANAWSFEQAGSEYARLKAAFADDPDGTLDYWGSLATEAAEVLLNGNGAAG